MKDSIEEEYFDPKYRGLDINTRFDAARTRIQKLDYDWQMFPVLAELLMEFDDSHTYLIMPPRQEIFDYGFKMQMVGKNCLVTSVTIGSDAEKAGLKVGDKILKVGEVRPDRDTLWKLDYLMNSLAPAEKVELTIRSGNLPEKLLEINSSKVSYKDYLRESKKRRDDERTEPSKCISIDTQIAACKLYTFDAETNDIDKMMKIVQGHSKLILDLRGNAGGSVDIEAYLTGYLFDHDFKMLDLVQRKKTVSRLARSKGKKAFSGELSILIDSESASAAEVLARVVQLKKRGTVFGDVSMGSVMTSVPIALMQVQQRFGYRSKAFPLVMSLSIGDVIMTDGERLEKKGVIPDIPMIPTGAALNRKQDPVLAAVLTRLGHKLSPDDAAKLGFMRASPTFYKGLETVTIQSQ